MDHSKTYFQPPDLPLIVKCKLEKNARLPYKVNAKAVGHDVYAYETKTLHPFIATKVSTGCAFEPPPGYYLRQIGVSQLVTVSNIHCTEGTLDSDFRGISQVILENHNNRDVILPMGTRIAQIVLVTQPNWKVLPSVDLTPTDRGTRGFGEMDTATSS